MLLALKIYLGLCCVFFALWTYAYWHMHKYEGLGIDMLDNSSLPRFIIVIIAIFLTVPITMPVAMVSKRFQNFCINVMDDEIYSVNDKKEDDDEVSNQSN